MQYHFALGASSRVNMQMFGVESKRRKNECEGSWGNSESKSPLSVLTGSRSCHFALVQLGLCFSLSLLLPEVFWGWEQERTRESTTRVKEDQSPIEIATWVRQNDDEGPR
jgi:hypothetical protein